MSDPACTPDPELSDDTYRLIVESTLTAKVLVDRNGCIVLVNRQVERLFGYKREELLGMQVEKLIPERFRARHTGGTEVPVEIGLSPFQTPEGQFVLASIIDITERRRAEAELTHAREELARRAEELEATVARRTEHLQRVVGELETFSYTASHDLRAPLRAVEGYAHFLLKRIGSTVDEESRGLLERMATSASRMDRLIQDLLAYSKIGRGEQAMEAIDLDAIISHIVNHYPGLEKARLRVKSPLGCAIGHDSLITQAISNLIGNAVKFVPKGRTPSIDIWTERKQGRVTIFVQDNGIGIDPEHQAKVFSPFIRLHPAGAYEGTGIGLAIVKKAVEQMGGRVGLKSTAGKGSTFSIELQDAA